MIHKHRVIGYTGKLKKKIVKGHTKMVKEKDFIIGFIGTDNFTTIKAASLKEAKKKFSELQGIRMSSHIVSRRKAQRASDRTRNTVFR